MTTSNSGRGYRYLPAVEQCSAGLCTDDTHELRRVEMPAILPIAEGFALIEEMHAKRALPATAVCAVELRSPAALTQEAFETLNRAYRGELARLDLLIGKDNPIARTNVCPVIDPPEWPAIHAFSYVVPRIGAATPSFVANLGSVPPSAATMCVGATKGRRRHRRPGSAHRHPPSPTLRDDTPRGPGVLSRS